MNFIDTKEKTRPGKSVDPQKEEKYNLILHNDEHNTFDFVIESLIKVCRHEPEQAEQCAFITHYKGKCDVKKGSFTFLKPQKDALTERGLSVTIDEI